MSKIQMSRKHHEILGWYQKWPSGQNMSTQLWPATHRCYSGTKSLLMCHWCQQECYAWQMLGDQGTTSSMLTMSTTNRCIKRHTLGLEHTSSLYCMTLMATSLACFTLLSGQVWSRLTLWIGQSDQWRQLFTLWLVTILTFPSTERQLHIANGQESLVSS